MSLLKRSRIVLFNALPAFLFLLLAYVNFYQFLHKGGHIRASHLLWVFQLTLASTLFIVRQPAREVTRSPLDTTMAFVGTFAPSLFSLEHPGPLEFYGVIVQVTGISFSIYAMVWLGRAMGIMPANRGVRTGGPYRWVRHPIYASYMICNAGYLVSHPGRHNLAVAVLCLFSQVFRIFAEERLLEKDPSYAAYERKVRWRMLPWVF